MSQHNHFSFRLQAMIWARRALLAAGVFCVSACSDSTSPENADVRFVLDSQGDAPATTSVSSTANAAGGPGVIVAIGRIVTPSPCFSLSPRVQKSGQSLDLAVVAQPTATGCISVLTSRGYTLRVGSLASGTYHVRLTHEIQGPSPLVELLIEKDVHVD